MASIKVKFRPSSVADHEGTVYYQIIHERKVRQLFSGYRVFPYEWNPERSMVKIDFKSTRKEYISYVRERIKYDLERFNRIEKKLEDEPGDYSIDDIIDEFNRYAHEYSLSNFMENIIRRLKENGRYRTSEIYRTTLNSFKNFLKSKEISKLLSPDGDLMLESLSADMMENYQAWQHSRKVAPNTISFYNRVLRAVYNRAVEEGAFIDRKPFRRVYTGVDKTVKRALPLDAIRKIRELDLSCMPSLDYARDMFMMSFFLRGMSFVDMAFLRKSDLKNGYVTYRRRKTGQRLVIAWTKEMQCILDKYGINDSEYLLPIIKKSKRKHDNKERSERIAYRCESYRINYNLKILSGAIGLPVPLTLYVARHSWASAARTKGVPLSVISEGMGHDSLSTTQIYLASLDTSVIDKANSLILSSI